MQKFKTMQNTGKQCKKYNTLKINSFDGSMQINSVQFSRPALHAAESKFQSNALSDLSFKCAFGTQKNKVYCSLPDYRATLLSYVVFLCCCVNVLMCCVLCFCVVVGVLFVCCCCVLLCFGLFCLLLCYLLLLCFVFLCSSELCRVMKLSRAASSLSPPIEGLAEG